MFLQGDPEPGKSTIDALDESNQKNSTRISISFLDNSSPKSALISLESKKSFGKVDCAVFDKGNYKVLFFFENEHIS